MTTTQPPEFARSRVQKISLQQIDKRWIVEVESFGGGPPPRRMRHQLTTDGVWSERVDAARGVAATGHALTVQGLLRKLLIGGQLLDVVVIQDGCCVVYCRATADDNRCIALIAEAGGDDGRYVVVTTSETAPATGLGADARILAVLGKQRAGDGRNLKLGLPYVLPKPVTLRQVAARAAGDSADATAHPLRAARQQLAKELQRLQRLDKAIARDLANAGEPDALLAQGLALQAAAATIERGQTHAAVVTADGTEVAIELDPRLSVEHNVGRIFRQMKRAKNAQLFAVPRLQSVQTQCAALREVLVDVDAALRAPTTVDVAALLSRIAQTTAAPAIAPSARRRAALTSKRQAWRSFALSDDISARVGRSAKDNDTLVKRSNGNDLWLHARGTSGSHVVIAWPQPEPAMPPDAAVRAAALLALHFSSSRGESGDVSVTRIKYLRKPGRGAPAGLVAVTQESVRHIRYDADQVAVLLAREVATTG